MMKIRDNVLSKEKVAAYGDLVVRMRSLRLKAPVGPYQLDEEGEIRVGSDDSEKQTLFDVGVLIDKRFTEGPDDDVNALFDGMYALFANAYSMLEEAEKAITILSGALIVE